MGTPHWSYETPQPWEERQGSLVDRVVRVSAEASRVYAQQAALLPTIAQVRSVDPAVGDHLADVGKRIQILHENARKPDKKALAIARKRGDHRRVIPSRFPEHGDDDGDSDEDDVAFVQGRIETMLMDQEWDTRTWNKAKIEIAVETLYEQVELSDDAQRRALATTMLVRLLESHESAVDYVESTLPILMNKAFRSLSKIVDMTRMFRVSTLLSVLAEWFVPILSRDNAIGKSMAFLLRETELCARIVQHHWRGVRLERSLATRTDIDASVRARLRSMHFIKNVELRHQFHVLRDVIGQSGLPLEAMRAYVKILFHLVKPTVSAVDMNRHHLATADQKRLLGSGILVILASYIPSAMAKVAVDQRDARRAIVEYVKGIALELTECFSNETDKIIEILKSNIVQRVVGDLDELTKISQSSAASLIHSCLQVIAALTKAVWRQCYNHRDHDSHNSASSWASHASSDALEVSFLMKRLQATTTQFLTTGPVMETLLRVLPLARQSQDAHMCELVLSTLRSLAGSFGFKQLLDVLTRNGGRALEQVILCFDWDASPGVARAAVALFHDMTNHPDARAGFTTAGAALLLSRWCDTDIAVSKNQPRFVLALCGLVLLARQHTNRKLADIDESAGNLLNSLGSLEARLDAMYAILLELVSGSSKDTRAAAMYLHQTTGVFEPILLRFLVRVEPSNMEPAFQTRLQRSISCIVLGRFFKVPALVVSAFSENTVIHIALSLQCNRLDEVEGKVRRSRSTEHERRLHFLGLKEACKALSRLARCPSGPGVDVSLRPSITSGNVPPLPQAIICDVVAARLHVLEDILPLIHVPTDAAEFLEIDTALALSAIELIGYLRPMPYGEVARQQFLKVTESHPHGKYATEKLEMLVSVAAPMILHVLREKSCEAELIAACCTALSRLAATNQARLMLLKQGAMFIALTHVPEVLYDSETSRKHHGGSGSPVKIDASVDDRGLLDVPPSLFTLLGKLCAIAEGRTAMMKAQVLPRALKRLQLTDTKRRDTDLAVKCEIAVLIRKLAMSNAVEGNTSELFLHFRVIELLAQIAMDQTLSIPSRAAPPQSPHKKCRITTAAQRQWRVLDNIVAAIAALAQDVLVCVPPIVRLDILAHLAPLLSTIKLGGAGIVGGIDIPQSGEYHHMAALPYHVVNIARAIATYPFGEYHGYLTQVRGAGIDGEEWTPSGPMTFMDRIKKIAFNFTLELQAGAPVGIEDSGEECRTIGELARDILAEIREREMGEERKHNTRASIQLPLRTSLTRSRPSSPHITLGSRQAQLPDKQQSPNHGLSFPALSPKPESLGSSSSCSKPCGGNDPRKDVLVPLASPPQTVLIPRDLDLLLTRPPPKPDNNQPLESHYIFARPNDKHQKKKSRRKEKGVDQSEQFLMLDPLFQNTPKAQPRRRHINGVGEVPFGDAREDGFVYVQEICHSGHQVNLRARRSKPGDKYIPSLGQLHVEDPSMNVLQRL